MWVIKKPSYGDQIRVNRGLYQHHGIYAADDCIYNFTTPGGSDVDPENAVVCISTLEEFLKGGILEVREYTEEELKEKKSPLDTVQYAKDHLGERGYSLISNNCEHFSNRCAFGESKSSQVEDIFQRIMGVFQK